MESFLNLASTSWNSPTVSPAGTLQNPWEDPYCFGSNNQMIQRLLAVGDGILFYPHNRHPNEDKTSVYTGYPIPCVRLEILRDAWESMGRPEIVTACATCADLLKKQLPEAKYVSLYELLDGMDARAAN